MNKRIGLIMGAMLLLPASAMAADGYGSAGCGLGSLIFGAKPGWIQILAATTNGTFASQTFGITTGTSNCSDTKGGSASAKIFIAANREALSKDIARGSGETVKNLATIAGCANPASVGPKLQQNFSSIFPAAETSTDQVAGSILNTLKSDATLSCSNLS